MVGIISYAASLPTLRLSADAYVEAWGSCGARGMKQKAFCAYDEDPVTLGIAAARAALSRLGRNTPKIHALFFGVTTPPYDEKPSASTIPTALFDYMDIRVTEISGSPQAGMQAIISAVEYCAADAERYAVAIAADAPNGPPDASFEHAFGAAGTAFVIGPDGVVADFQGTLGVTRETFGARFRRHGQEVLSDLELRTKDNLASAKMLGEQCSVLGPVTRLALGAEAGLMRGIGRAFGNPDAIVDTVWSQIGDAGSASAPFALASAFDEMRINESVLAISLGSGGTACLFKTREGLAKNRRRGESVASLIRGGRTVGYLDYLKHKRFLSSRKGGNG
ncbi:MAG: hypothetical protein VW226_02790 [Rhodospirillaceae bacterium]